MAKTVQTKIIAIATALVLALTLFSSAIMASASVNPSNKVSKDNVDFIAEKISDTEIRVSLKATKDVGIETIQGEDFKLSSNLSYAGGAFSTPKAFKDNNFNPNFGEFLLQNAATIDFSNGDTIFSFVVTTDKAIEENVDYVIDFAIVEAYYYDASGTLQDLSWRADKIHLVYREDTDIQTFNVKIIDDGRTVLDQDIEEGKTVAKPADGSKNGYTFDGWFADGENTPYDFSKPVTKPLNIVARYTKNTPSGNKVVDLNDIKITKTIKSAKHLDPEEKNFTFTFKALDGAPEIGTRNITNSDTIALGDITFPGPGVYKYEISEDKDASATDWTYDSTVYYLAITIQEDANGNLTATPIAISKQADFSGDKVGSADFENEYAPATELTVSKDVVNAEGALDKDKKFSFTITFENPGVSGDLKDKTNNKSIAFDAPYTFTLGDDEEITFALPAGTQYTLVEDGTTAYEAKADVYSGSEQGTPATAEAGKDLSVTAVALKNGNAVEVTNTYTVTPLMGVVHKYGAVLVAMLIALAAIVAIVWDRKRKLQSEE